MPNDPMTPLREYGLRFERPLSESQKAVEDRSRSIFSNLSVYLKQNVRTDGVWKISINLNSPNPRQHLKTVGGVLKYNALFDAEPFLALSVDEQKHTMLGFVENTLTDVFLDLNLDANLIKGFGDFVRGRNFANVFSGPKSANGSLAANIVCVQGFTETEVFLRIEKSGVEVEKIFVQKSSPEEFIFQIYLVEPKWLPDGSLEITASNGERFKIDRTE